MRYDACIIGAGADGLAAAAWLAARGLDTIVVERNVNPGGRCITREFHPGFWASPFADVLPEIPPSIFRALDLARRGAVFAPCEAAAAGAVSSELLARLDADAESPPRRRLFAGKHVLPPWPGEELAARSLADFGVPAPLDARLCDPSLTGSALTLLAAGTTGMPAGGLGRLGRALRSAAEEAGASISCGLEVSDIRLRRGKAVVAGLADGSEIAARAFISTLDFKRTFLSLFTWNELPPALVERVGAFRPAPGTARLLVALGSLPDDAVDERWRAPLRVAEDGAAEAHRAWRAATVAPRPPATLRLVSAVDPFLAPQGGATLTVTLGGIPHTPFDGAWTHDKRNKLRDAALKIVEEVLPGASARILAAELIVPPDVENQLGLTQGDLIGGELGATQMLGFRPFCGFGPECCGTRTPVGGLYLAGPSSALGPLMTCASGVAAARAVLADMAAGRLK